MPAATEVREPTIVSPLSRFPCLCCARLIAFAATAIVLAPLAANAVDANDIPDNVAFSSVPTLLHLCGGDAAILSEKVCTQDYYGQNAAALDLALRDALGKAP